MTKNLPILLAFAEQEKEHGYSVLAAKKAYRNKISPCPFAVERSTATLFWHYLLYKQRLCFGKKNQPTGVIYGEYYESKIIETKAARNSSLS